MITLVVDCGILWNRPPLRAPRGASRGMAGTMAKLFLRQKEVSKIIVRPPSTGSRAVFIVETDGKRERRQVQELFGTVAELADAIQLSDGQIMAYAVQLRGDTSLIAKIEWLL